MAQCMRVARQLPEEHIQLVMVIKNGALKQATLKQLFEGGGAAEEPLADILGYICVKSKVSNKII